MRTLHYYASDVSKLIPHDEELKDEPINYFLTLDLVRYITQDQAIGPVPYLFEVPAECVLEVGNWPLPLIFKLIAIENPIDSNCATAWLHFFDKRIEIHFRRKRFYPVDLCD